MLRAPALLVLTALASVSCGSPRDASPMPEPPSLDLSKIGPYREVVTDTVVPATTVIPLEGQAGTAPPGSILRVTPLDSIGPAIVVSIREDGGFDEITIPGVSGNELRFQVVEGTARSAPQDAFYLQPPGGTYYLTPSLRYDCLTLAPGFEVTFASMGVATLTLTNGCSSAVTVANPVSRTGAPGSRTSTPLPLTIAAGESARLTLEFQGSAFGGAEDTLFFDVTLDNRAIRYPITLFAP